MVSCPIKLLKLEAEGGEPEVLLGSSTILNHIEFISADLGFERGLNSESTLPAVSNFLLPMGFRFVDLSKNRLVSLFSSN